MIGIKKYLFLSIFIRYVSGIVGFHFQLKHRPQLRIRNGVIIGEFWKTRGNRTISAFTSIPYAESPVGDLRFKAPVPKRSWLGVLNATGVHVACPQRDTFDRSLVISGEEDCLFINVYTPKVESFERDLLPVMVIFHGGGFLAGSGNSQVLSPDILLDKDLVLVVMNYRLGPLGFLSTGDDVVPGNNGLKDQNLALKWVHKNIKSFGGDASKVTIFGHSAGGISVHYHMLSPLSKGLFHRVISQSGNIYCPYAFGEDNETVTNTKKLAKALNCPTNKSKDMVNCLRKFDANSIIAQDRIFLKWDYDPVMPFKITAEPDIAGAFLTDNPLNLMKTGQCMDVPVLTGFTKDEGAIKVAGFKNLNLLKEFAQRFDEIAPYSVYSGPTKNDTPTVTKAIREFYFGDRKIEDSVDDIIKLYGDSWINRSVDQFTKALKQYYTQPVYRYIFTYRGSESMTEVFKGGMEDYGVCHADDLIYFTALGKSIRPDWIPTKNDSVMIDLYSTLLTNFVITGNPTPSVNELINIQWQPYTLENEESLNLYPGNLRMENKIYKNRTEFWENIMVN